MHMQMTEGEIRRAYKSSRHKEKQISILADLNCCSKEKILDIVHGGREVRTEKETCEPLDLGLMPEVKALIDRLDELDAMIKPLEDEYMRTAEALMQITG